MIQPPPVPGIGNAGGFRMMVEDRAGRGPQALQAAVGAMMGARRADAGRAAGVLAVRDLDAAALSRYRPHQGADARRQRRRRVRGAADLPRLGLCERLQPVRPHLPGDRAGERRVPQRSERRAEDPRAQFERRHRAARLVHHRARHLRAVSGAALQSLPCRRARRRRGAAATARGRRSRSWRSSPPRCCPTASATNGRRSRSSSCAPATRRSSPSRSRSCSSSSCSPRNTKA